MIPMRQFLREHDISGDVEATVTAPSDIASLETKTYRLVLRRDLRTYQATLQRPSGAPAPSLGAGIAECARRAAMALDGRGAFEALEEAKRLKTFLGDEAYAELLFEFGHRPEADIEAGDAVAEPARPDEMTNQEPDALAGAKRDSRALGRARYLIGAPLLLLGASGLLLARGRRATAVAVASGGAALTVLAAGAITQWRRRAQATSERETLGSLTDQNTSIQTGSTPS